MTVDYKPIANGGSANVESQAQYLIDLAGGGTLVNGYQTGLAKSVQFNKTFRQASMIAAAVATFIANELSVDVLDDGDLAALVTKLTSAIAAGGSGLLASNNTWTGTNTFNKQTVGLPLVLTNAATVTPNFANNNNFVLPMQGGNVLLASPSNAVAGQGGCIAIQQDSGTPRVISYGSAWKFPGGVASALTPSIGAWDLLSYYCIANNSIFTTLARNES